MEKTRILFKDTDGQKTSTSAWVVNAKNHLLQIRQFATDGVRFFYQPKKQDPFIIVSETEMPTIAKELLESERNS